MSLMGKTLPSFQSISLLFFGFFVCWFVCFVLFWFGLVWFGLFCFVLVWFGLVLVLFVFLFVFLERAVSFSQLAYEYQIILPQSWSIKYSLKTKSSMSGQKFFACSLRHRSIFRILAVLDVLCRPGCPLTCQGLLPLSFESCN